MTDATPSLGADLHALALLVDRAADRVLSTADDDGVTYRRYVVMTAIGQLGAPTQRELAERVGASEAAVSRMLATLAAAGLVTAAVDPAHRRRNAIRLTPAGEAVERRVGRHLDGAMSSMLAAVGVDETGFHDAVERLRGGFRDWLGGADIGAVGGVEGIRS